MTLTHKVYKGFVSTFAGLLTVAPVPATDVAKDAYEHFFDGNQKGIEQRVDIPRKSGLEGFLGIESAYAQDEVARMENVKWESVHEYYNRSEPVDYLPGARKGDYVVSLRESGSAFVDVEWTNYYINNKESKGEQLQDIFRNIHGKTVKYNGTSTTFNYFKFDEFAKKEHENIKSVGLYGDYLIFSYRDKSKKIIIPVGSDTVRKVIALFKG